MTQSRLFIFDVDGTLCKLDHTELLPKRAEKLQALAAVSGTQFALATNQGGVGMRRWMEADRFGKPQGYPTEEQVWERLHTLCANMRALGCEVTPFVAFTYTTRAGKQAPIPADRAGALGWDHAWRKPNAGMLKAAMAKLPANEILMVGDRPEDEGAAINAGVSFVHADSFFD